MRGGKRYSNVTFTKRVDHEAGRHRPARAPSEPRSCSSCRAVYTHRRWVPSTDPGAVMLRAAPATTVTLCPACRIRASGVPSGYLHVEGRFYLTHRQDVEQLLENEAARAAADNPTGRIMRWDRPNGHELIVTTTTEHLAGRLGHALHSAFRGAVHYDFGHENKVARVTWQRD